jgi:hypothetical protein
MTIAVDVETANSFRQSCPVAGGVACLIDSANPGGYAIDYSHAN